MFNRREFLNSLGAAGAAGILSGRPPRAEAQETVRRFRIWDVHSHLHSVPGDTPEKRMEVLVRCADRLGIERIILSQGYSSVLHPTADQIREENDRVMRAVRAFPDRAYGSVYLSPSYLDFSLQELDRCVRDGPMVSIGEIEAEARCNVPGMGPIAERPVAMHLPILQPQWAQAGR